MAPPDRLPDPDKIEWLSESRANAVASPPGREKRKLSPELEKLSAEMTPLKAWLRTASDASLLGAGPRFQSWRSGRSVEDEAELSARAEEKSPMGAGFVGNTLAAIPIGATAAASAPGWLGGASVAAATRAALASGLFTGTAKEGIKSAEGRGPFDVGNVLMEGLFSSLTGPASHYLPKAVGHSKSIFAGMRDTPLSAAQKAAVGPAGPATQAANKYNFTGDAALDLAEKMRYSEDPGMAGAAAALETLKTQAGPSFRAASEAAREAKGLNKFMDSSVPKQRVVKGVNKGEYQQYPEMSGKAVGQTRDAIPHTTVMPPRGPIPPAAQQALDDAYLSRRDLWNQQQKHGTGDVGRPPPQREEFGMWEDVLNPKRTNLTREELAQTREALRHQPGMANRMFLENQADEVARLRGAIRNAPENPPPPPWTLSAGFGIPQFLNRFVPGNTRLPFAGLSKEIKPIKRFDRAAQYARHPDAADIIGKLTAAQALGGGAARGALEELIDEFSATSRSR